MSLRPLWIAACLAACGCASTQLNYNTADLASSLNSLTKRQIFFNLAQALTDTEFVPSQVTISVGTAQTLNSVTPSISVPLGNPVVTTSRVGTAGSVGRGDFFSTAVTSPTPSLGLQFEAQSAPAAEVAALPAQIASPQPEEPRKPEQPVAEIVALDKFRKR